MVNWKAFIALLSNLFSRYVPHIQRITLTNTRCSYCYRSISRNFLRLSVILSTSPWRQTHITHGRLRRFRLALFLSSLSLYYKAVHSVRQPLRQSNNQPIGSIGNSALDIQSKSINVNNSLRSRRL